MKIEQAKKIIETQIKTNCKNCGIFTYTDQGKYKPTFMVNKYLLNIKNTNKHNNLYEFICYDCYKLLIANLYDNWYPKFTKD